MLVLELFHVSKMGAQCSPYKTKDPIICLRELWVTIVLEKIRTMLKWDSSVYIPKKLRCWRTLSVKPTISMAFSNSSYLSLSNFKFLGSFKHAPPSEKYLHTNTYTCNKH